MKIKPLLMAAALAFASPAVPADTIDSKVEYQGPPRDITVTGLMAKERNGLMALQVELTNKDHKPQQAFYRLKWLDETGFQVWDDEPWKPVLLHGYQKQNLQVVAPTARARDFRVQFNPNETEVPKDPNAGAPPSY